MSVMFNRLALVALACAVAAPAGAQLVQRKDLSYAVAKTAAENALDDCKTKGYAVSVVVVDLGRVRQITSRALGAIVDSTNRLAQRQGRVAVAGVSTRIQKVMDTLKLSTLIASFESAQAAIDAKGSRPAN